MRITLSGDNLNNVEGQSYSILSLHWRQEDNTKRNSVPQVTTNKKSRSSHAGQRSAGQPYWTGSHILMEWLSVVVCASRRYTSVSIHCKSHCTSEERPQISTALKEHHSTKCKSVMKS